MYVSVAPSASPKDLTVQQKQLTDLVSMAITCVHYYLQRSMAQRHARNPDFAVHTAWPSHRSCKQDFDACQMVRPFPVILGGIQQALGFSYDQSKQCLATVLITGLGLVLILCPSQPCSPHLPQGWRQPAADCYDAKAITNTFQGRCGHCGIAPLRRMACAKCLNIRYCRSAPILIAVGCCALLMSSTCDTLHLIQAASGIL